MSADRERGAERLLAEHGLAASVGSAGHAGDIAVVGVGPESLADLASQSAAIRALGYRYVAIDITPSEPPSAPA